MHKEQTIKRPAVNRKYYDIISKDRNGVELRSKRTNQFWRVMVTDSPKQGCCFIYHKHRYSHPFHKHGEASSFEAAMSMIAGHDKYNAEDRSFKIAE